MKFELLRRYEPTVGNTHTVERPIEISDPVVQEVHELRKLRGQVVILPDAATIGGSLPVDTGFLPWLARILELAQKGCVRHRAILLWSVFSEYESLFPAAGLLLSDTSEESTA